MHPKDLHTITRSPKESGSSRDSTKLQLPSIKYQGESFEGCSQVTEPTIC
jgi:hypothetical protein